MRKLHKTSLLTIGSLLFAMLQLHFILLIFHGDFQRSIDAAQGVVAGYPHWMIYQSRVLGPYLIQFLSTFLRDYTTAYYCFMLGTATLANLAILWVADRIQFLAQDPSYAEDGGLIPLMALLFFTFLLISLVSQDWLYAWDHLGVLFFILFYYFVFSEKKWPWFVGLFSIAVFNRESAYFIALWMVINPMIQYVINRAQRFNWQLFMAGLACFIAGALIIHTLRAQLLIQEIMPNQPELLKQSFLYQLPYNIKQIQTNFMQFNIVIPLVFLSMLLLLSGRLSMQNPYRYLGLALTQTAMVVATFCFALLQETRALLELVPLMSLSLLALRHKKMHHQHAPFSLAPAS